MSASAGPRNGSYDLSLRIRGLNGIKLASREDVLNVFTPRSEITAPAKFAGRERALEEMIDALLSEGTDMVLFGERGVGKTSLAYMLSQIARGRLEILDSYYGLRERLEKKGRLSWLRGTSHKDFKVVWVDGFGSSLDQVLHAILTRRQDERHGPGIQAFLTNEADKLEVSSKIGFKNQILTAEGGIKQTFTRDGPVDIREGFQIAMQRYASENSEEILIIVDEFDTVRNKEGIAHYLKNLRRARFVLVGIAETTLELIGEHESVSRAIQAVELEPMTGEELRLILEIGSFILSRVCSYTPEAMEEIVRNCYGSPFWCHFLAKLLLVDQMDAAGGFEAFSRATVPKTISSEDVRNLVASLSQRPEAKIYEGPLQSITLQSDKLRKVVRAIAASPNAIISSAVVSSSLSAEGISEQDTLAAISQIINMKSSPLRRIAQILDVISFTFNDPNFKRYILIRNAGLPAAGAAP